VSWRAIAVPLGLICDIERVAVLSRARQDPSVFLLQVEVVTLRCELGEAELRARLVQQVLLWCDPGKTELMSAGAGNFEVLQRVGLQNSIRRETRASKSVTAVSFMQERL